MMRMPRRIRRGFSLVEIITALTILSIIGVALTKMVLMQTRSFQHENAGRRARTASRSAMNILITDLRMLQDIGGIDSVDVTNHRWIDVKVPIGFGFICEINATNAMVSMVAVDSFQTASSKYGGYAVRDAAGTYTYRPAGTSDTIRSAPRSKCVNAGIYGDTATIAGRSGRVMAVQPAPPGTAAVGDPMFVWQSVRYHFDTSGIYSGRRGLYRTIRGLGNTDKLTEELIAPFNATARFSYFTNPPQTRDVATNTAPVDLNQIRGFRIYLPAESSDTVQGHTAPQRANTTTAVFFKNTRIQ